MRLPILSEDEPIVEDRMSSKRNMLRLGIFARFALEINSRDVIHVAHVQVSILLFCVATSAGAMIPVNTASWAGKHK